MYQSGINDGPPGAAPGPVAQVTVFFSIGEGHLLHGRADK